MGELAQQLERHLLVLIERRQGLLRKLLQLDVLTTALFLLKELHPPYCGLRPCHACTGRLTGLAVQRLELFSPIRSCL